jgi:hypothetical protein
MFSFMRKNEERNLPDRAESPAANACPHKGQYSGQKKYSRAKVVISTLDRIE